MSSSKVFSTILNNINVVLKRENLREYNEEDFLSKMYERYIIFCKSRSINPVVKNVEKFSIKFKVYLSKDKSYVQTFFNNYFTDDLNSIYYNFNLSLTKPKEEKIEKIEKIEKPEDVSKVDDKDVSVNVNVATKRERVNKVNKIKETKV